MHQPVFNQWIHSRDTISVNKIELTIPPIIATASGTLISEPSPVPRAAGNMEIITVSDVISTGRILIGQASSSASSILLPCRRNWLVRSISNMEFRHPWVLWLRQYGQVHAQSHCPGRVQFLACVLIVQSYTMFPFSFYIHFIFFYYLLCLPLRQIESNSQIPPITAPINPSSPNRGSPSSVGPPSTVMTMEEPIMRAAVTVPTVSRLAARSSRSAKLSNRDISTLIWSAPCHAEAINRRRSWGKPVRRLIVLIIIRIGLMHQVEVHLCRFMLKVVVSLL